VFLTVGGILILESASALSKMRIADLVHQKKYFSRQNPGTESFIIISNDFSKKEEKYDAQQTNEVK